MGFLGDPGDPVVIRGWLECLAVTWMQTGKTMKGKLAYFNRRGNRLG